MGAGELLILLIIILAVVGVPVLVGIGLVLWAFRVASTQGTPRYRVLRFLPVAGLVLYLMSVIVGVISTVARMATVAGVDPADKARRLAEGISESMNLAAVFSIVTWGCYIASAIASWRGSRPPELPPV